MTRTELTARAAAHLAEFERLNDLVATAATQAERDRLILAGNAELEAHDLVTDIIEAM